MSRNAVATAPSRSEHANGFPLLVPDILVPSQYYGQLARRSDLTPEKKLQVAVLESALYDMQRYRNARRAREQRLFRESYAWFTSEDDNGPFAFITICHSLELDPIYIRKGVLSSAQVTQEN